jgi:trimeric autotransporter adhesin
MPPGAITTVAGNGTAGYSGDNGPAISATLNTPYGLNISSAGNLYIADANNNVIRMVTAAGVITTVAGNGTLGYSGDGGPVTSAILNNPDGLAFDAQGNLYISDQGNNRVREVNTPAGSVLFPTTAVNATSAVVTIPLLVNTPGTTITGITAPVSQGGKQEYTVAAPGCALNTALDAGTLCNVTVTFTPGYPGPRPVPLQVASSAGTIGFGMMGAGTAPQVALSPGIINTIASTDPFALNSPLFALYGDFARVAGAVAVDSAGNIYLGVEAPEGRIGAQGIAEVAAGTGIVTNILSPIQQAEAAFGFALDGAGNLYAASAGNSCIYEVVPGASSPIVVAGSCGGFEVSTAGFGGDNGPAVAAQLNGPSGVAVDSAGNLYIADSGNNRIRKITAVSGVITTIAGNGAIGYSGDNGPATSAQLNNPIGLAIDGAGDLYVADSFSPSVRMVNAAGIITTVAGTGASGSTGDGGVATAATLDVNGMALDSAGNLYISGDAVRTVNVSASALTFPAAQIGSTSTQTAAVTNIGNTPLSFTVPASGQNPSLSTGFTLDSTASCPQLGVGSQQATLASGMSCSLVVDFAPSTTAAITGTATIADNALNTNVMQTVQLTAGAGETVATTTTVNVANPVYGQTAVSATILATAGTLVPVGSVVFTVDGTAQPAVPVDASGLATLPSTISSALAVGSHTIGAAYTSSSLGFSNSVATRIFSVSQVPPSVTMAPSASSLSVAAGASVTDTLTLTSIGGYVGTLQFACSSLPQNATCNFQPATITLSSTSGPQTTVVTIQTAGAAAAVRHAKLFTAAAFWVPGLLLMILAGSKRKPSSRDHRLVILLALLAGTWVVNGCSSGGSPTQSTTPNAPSTPVTPATPAGTSTVQITASATGSAVQSFSLTLTVH